MIYRPGEGERLWDSWLFGWEERVHLFYLASQGGRFAVGHAVSDDLVHWQRLEDLIVPHWPFTGMVVRHGGRFVMVLGESVDNVQTAVFYESEDLASWQAMAGACRLRPAGPHYVDAPSDRWPHVWWRDPFLFQVEGDDSWHALICATRPDDGPDHTGAVLAHVRTRDFATWEHLPPLDGPTGRFYHNEVPEHFVHDGRHYVLFSTGSCAGIRVQTPGRRETAGTYYMVADRLEGPYRLPEDPLLVGAGYARLASYVARTIEFGGQRMLYHHIRDDSEKWDGTWAAPKRLDVEPDGTLTVRYWDGLAALERRTVVEAASAEITHGVAGAAETVARDLADLHVTARLRYRGDGRCGVVVRSADGSGVMLSLDFQLGAAEIGVGRRHDLFGWGADVTGFAMHPPQRDQRFVLDRCALPLELDRDYELRILARGEHVEAYLDGRWLFTTHVPEAPARGDVELLTERGRATFHDVCIAELEPWTLSAYVGERPMALSSEN